MADRSHLSIGEVLSLLQDDFPDVTISKIRFLESQGLLDPERTPSGYRKFYEPDIERLRWILRHQRDHFLPLKVIKDRLEESAARGLMVPPDEPPAGEGAGSQSLFDDAPGDAEPTPSAVPENSAEETSDYQPIPVPERAARAAVPPVPSTPTTPAPTVEPPRLAPTPPAPARAAAPPATAPAIPAAATATPAAPTSPLRTSPDLTRPARPVPARPVPPVAPLPTSSSAATASPLDPGPSTASFTLDELASASGLEAEQLAELVKYNLINGRKVGGDVFYDADELVVARMAAGFVQFGIEARHLRMYKVAADREAGFIEQVVMPLLKQRNPTARKQAADNLGELARLGESLRSALLRGALRDHTDLR